MAWLFFRETGLCFAIAWTCDRWEPLIDGKMQCCVCFYTPLCQFYIYSVSSYGTPGRFFHSKKPDSRPTQSPSTTIENPKPAIDPEINNLKFVLDPPKMFHREVNNF